MANLRITRLRNMVQLNTPLRQKYTDKDTGNVTIYEINFKTIAEQVKTVDKDGNDTDIQQVINQVVNNTDTVVSDMGDLKSRVTVLETDTTQLKQNMNDYVLNSDNFIASFEAALGV